MPFEIAQPEVKVGKFQRFADAMRRGAALTLPAPRQECTVTDKTGRVTHTCAFYAMQYGLYGEDHLYGNTTGAGGMGSAYRAKYGSCVVSDYEVNGLTREAIADRIAAL